MSESSTRQRLLEAALHLVWENSYGAVGVEEICQRAGVKKGSFYHAFKSKSDLATAAFEYYWEQKQAKFDSVFSPELPALERLRGYCRLVIGDQKKKFRASGKVLGCPFSSVGCEQSTLDENIRQKACELSDRLVKYLESAIGDLRDGGFIRLESSPSDLAKEVYAYTIGVITQAKIDNDVGSLDHIGGGVCRLLGLSELDCAASSSKTAQRSGGGGMLKEPFDLDTGRNQ